MKRIALGMVVALVMTLAPALVSAQDHVTVGAFADYLRLNAADNANMFGLGGRFGFYVHKHVALEANMSYDFEKNFTSVSTSGGTTTFLTTSLRTLHGIFGPKFEFGSHNAKVFVVAKGGFVNFSVSGAGAINGFTGAVTNFGTGNTSGAFYPGGGFELYAGPIGIRLDAGDLMYWDDFGVHHNLSVQLGPQFRF